MTNHFIWEKILHPLANIITDFSQLAEIKVPNWIKHRIVEKLYWIYKRRWRSWKTTKTQQSTTVDEDSTCCYFDCDENGNTNILPTLSFNAAAFAEKHLQNIMEWEYFQTTLTVTTASDNEVKNCHLCQSDEEPCQHRTQERKRRDSTLSLNEPVLTPIRKVFPGSIPVTDVQLTRLLGAGGFGTVYYGTIGERTPVAVKKMRTCSKNLRAKSESFRAELKVLKLEHPNIVRTLAASDPLLDKEADDEGNLVPTLNLEEAYIIMEYTGDINLQQVNINLLPL